MGRLRRALSPWINAEGVTGANPSRPAVHVTNVLVPLDGSELALQAMPTARVLAQRLGADLHTVTVADGEDDAERARALASAALGVPLAAGRVSVVTEGDAAEVIARRAETLGSCVVCMATHGRGRLGARSWVRWPARCCSGRTLR